MTVEEVKSFIQFRLDIVVGVNVNTKQASKIYIGSVLFRASAFTGAKLASGAPAVIGHYGP